MLYAVQIIRKKYNVIFVIVNLLDLQHQGFDIKYDLIIFENKTNLYLTVKTTYIEIESTRILERKKGIGISRICYDICEYIWMKDNKTTRIPLICAIILADDIFKCIFWNENYRIPIQISLKFLPVCPIDNKRALVQVMAWCRTSDKPLLEPMMTQFTDAYV